MLEFATMTTNVIQVDELGIKQPVKGLKNLWVIINPVNWEYFIMFVYECNAIHVVVNYK